MELTAILALITELSKAITALVGSHEKALADKDKEIESLKKIVDGLKPPPA